MLRWCAVRHECRVSSKCNERPNFQPTYLSSSKRTRGWLHELEAHRGNSTNEAHHAAPSQQPNWIHAASDFVTLPTADHHAAEPLSRMMAMMQAIAIPSRTPIRGEPPASRAVSDKHKHDRGVKLMHVMKHNTYKMCCTSGVCRAQSTDFGGFADVVKARCSLGLKHYSDTRFRRITALRHGSDKVQQSI